MKSVLDEDSETRGMLKASHWLHLKVQSLQCNNSGAQTSTGHCTADSTVSYLQQKCYFCAPSPDTLILFFLLLASVWDPLYVTGYPLEGPERVTPSEPLEQALISQIKYWTHWHSQFLLSYEHKQTYRFQMLQHFRDRPNMLLEVWQSKPWLTGKEVHLPAGS